MSKKTTIEKERLTPKDLSKMWKIAEGTLANWRAQKRGPKFVKIGRNVLYRTIDVERYESKHLVD